MPNSQKQQQDPRYQRRSDDPNAEPYKRRWVIDRHINLALIITILAGCLGNVAYGVWRASKYDSRIEALEEYVGLHKDDPTTVAVLNEKVTTLQGTTKEIKDSLSKQSDKLDQLLINLKK